MAITKVWEVNKCRFETADKYIYEVIYRVKGMDGETEKWRETGMVSLPKPDTLVAYDSLTYYCQLCFGISCSACGVFSDLCYETLATLLEMSSAVSWRHRVSDCLKHFFGTV